MLNPSRPVHSATTDPHPSAPQNPRVSAGFADLAATAEGVKTGTKGGSGHIIWHKSDTSSAAGFSPRSLEVSLDHLCDQYQGVPSGPLLARIRRVEDALAAATGA